MWIRSEEDLRRHLDDPTGREGHAFEYKGAIDNDPRKGRGADFASSVASLANADGGQVLLGVRDKDGAPGKVVDVGKLEAVGQDIEDTISKFLVGIEPRPTWQPFDYEGSTRVLLGRRTLTAYRKLKRDADEAEAELRARIKREEEERASGVKSWTGTPDAGRVRRGLPGVFGPRKRPGRGSVEAAALPGPLVAGVR